jgi:predicted nicotinamide N-methyase
VSPFPLPPVSPAGYDLVHESVGIFGLADLQICRLKDKQQFDDPLGLAAAQGISSAAWPLFGLVWPSGLHLAAALGRRPVTASERILEVGCGLALASLVGHRRGACMTASDCHPLTRLFLDENLRLNALGPLRYRHGHWAARTQPEDDGGRAAPEEEPGRLVQGRFELIIGSDVLYERDDRGLLAGFIELHGAAKGEVMIVDPQRGNRSAFHRRMAGLGYEMQQTLLSSADGIEAPYRGSLFHYQRRAQSLIARAEI